MVANIGRDDLRTRMDRETPSSSSKCWPLSTIGTLTCQER